MLPWSARFWLSLLATLAVGIPLLLAFGPVIGDLTALVAGVANPDDPAAYSPGIAAWIARGIGVALSGIGVGILLLAYLAMVILPRRGY